MSVLVTGGAGYIGSHTAVELLGKGYDVIIVDDFSNSSKNVINRIETITGKKVTFYNLDLKDKEAVEILFENHNIDSVIHFAGYKAVGESVELPLKYYTNNLISTLNLCELMNKYSVYNLIFSSSATVYGMPDTLPLTEDCSTSALNPYGRTKLMIEEILTDLSLSNTNWKIALLRYFNPVGAHSSGLIGENPNGIPNNLMPYITQVAIGELKELSIFGGNYSTPDGTGVRDYIHVVDLAKGHLSTLEHLDYINGIESYNLGTGRGYSVLEVIKMFEKASGIRIPYKIVERRAGDAAACYADPQKAYDELGWKADKDLYDMCWDSWQWEKNKRLARVN